MPRLNPRVVTFFKHNGYVVLDHFFSSEECDEMLSAGREFPKHLPSKDERAKFTSVVGEEKYLREEEYFINSNDKISYFFENAALDANGELVVDRSVCLNMIGHALHYLDPLFRCYTYCDRVKSVVRGLGFREPAVVQSMYVYRNPGVCCEVLPHQDSTYLNAEPIAPVGFWIALEDTTIDNSCLWVMRSSHTTGVHRRLIRNYDKSQKYNMVYDRPCPKYPESSFTPLPVRKGSCILLDGKVVHKSHYNRSNKSHHAYIFHVIEQKWNRYSPENWLQEGPNAPFTNLYETSQFIN